MGDITEEDGRTFAGSDERDEYIRKTFADLYKKPDENILGPDCITEFLEDVAENETVLNAKLDNTEKENLDRNLTIEELDQSIIRQKQKARWVRTVFRTNSSRNSGIYTEYHCLK